MDDLDPLGPINTPRIRLRALWGDFPVVVRVHLGALRSMKVGQELFGSAVVVPKWTDLDAAPPIRIDGCATLDAVRTI